MKGDVGLRCPEAPKHPCRNAPDGNRRKRQPTLASHLFSRNLDSHLFSRTLDRPDATLAAKLFSSSSNGLSLGTIVALVAIAWVGFANSSSSVSRPLTSASSRFNRLISEINSLRLIFIAPQKGTPWSRIPLERSPVPKAEQASDLPARGVAQPLPPRIQRSDSASART